MNSFLCESVIKATSFTLKNSLFLSQEVEGFDHPEYEAFVIIMLTLMLSLVLKLKW